MDCIWVIRSWAPYMSQKSATRKSLLMGFQIALQTCQSVISLFSMPSTERDFSVLWQIVCGSIIAMMSWHRKWFHLLIGNLFNVLQSIFHLESMWSLTYIAVFWGTALSGSACVGMSGQRSVIQQKLKPPLASLSFARQPIEDLITR